MADEKRDYYEVLGVSKTANADEIKSAYRKLAMKWHPDRNPDKKEEATKRFTEISEAYEVLSDPQKRAQYDQFGFAGNQFGPGGFDFERDFTHGVDLSDLFGAFFGGGFGGRGGFGFDFGGGNGGHGGPVRGNDLRFDLEIDFEEALYGSKRTVSLNINDACETCGGTGAAPGSKRVSCRRCSGRGFVVQGGGIFQLRQTCPACGGEGTVIENPCRSCNGSGFVRRPHKITLTIPKGVETGSRLRVPGKGEAGPNGGPPGDLHVVLHVREHEVFERHGDDLLCTVFVRPEIAALGGDVQVPTPDGWAKLRLPAETLSGKVFRLRDKGMPRLSGGNGDLHVQIVVEVPTSLSSKQRKALAEFAALCDDGNFPLGNRLNQQIDSFYKKRDALSGGH